jgi:hypothetical protein
MITPSRFATSTSDIEVGQRRLNFRIFSSPHFVGAMAISVSGDYAKSCLRRRRERRKAFLLRRGWARLGAARRSGADMSRLPAHDLVISDIRARCRPVNYERFISYRTARHI